MGGQLLVILPQPRVLGPYGERYHRRTVELGHGTQAGITVVTSSYQEEDKLTLKVGGRGEDWDLPYREVFDVLRCRFQRDGKGTQGVEKTLRKGMGSWWRDAEIYRSKSVSAKTKCQRVVSHVFSTALNSSANWTWNVYNARMVHHWETKILRLTFRPKDASGRRVGDIQGNELVLV